MSSADGEIRVGVTGHRALAHPDLVADQVDAILDRLSAGFTSPLVAVSSLAEGADRLVAHRILARGGRLVALLPFEPVDYIVDFADVASVQEFTDLVAAADEMQVILGAPTDDWTREAAYERAGHAVLDRSDVLLALWDGQPSAGRGGTAEVVAEAKLIGRPVEVVTVERAAS